MKKRIGLDLLEKDPDMPPWWVIILGVILAVPVIWAFLVFFLTGFFGLLPTGS